MKDLSILVDSAGLVGPTVGYLPAPCRGTVAKVTAVWQTNAVTAADTVTVARNTTTVNLVTAVSGDGLIPEIGVPDTTNGQLVFDPEDDTEENQVIKITPSAGGAVFVAIQFDDSAYVKQTPKEA